MKYATAMATVAAATVAGLLTLTACGGGAGGGHGTGAAAPGGNGPQALKVKATVPQAFDNSKGWQDALPWVPEDATGRPFAVAPGAGIVALLKKKGGSYVLEARDEATGALRFSGRPWQPPEPQESAGGRAETPGVEAVERDGREYLAVWAHGLDGKDALSKGKEVVAVALYPAGTSGTSAAPARVVKVPVESFSSVARVRDAGAGLLVTTKGGDESVSVDPRTGRTKRYPHSLEVGEPTCGAIGCVSSEVKALTRRGPVLDGSAGGFGIPGVWNSSRAVPPGAKTDDYEKYKSRARLAVSGHLLASWTAKDDEGDGGDGGDGDDIWAVHNAETGKVEASVRCALDSLTDQGSGEDYPSALSLNGRYLTAGPLAFDLKKGKGYCFAEGDEQRQILLLSVGDDGQAYGMTQGDAAGTAGAAVAVPLSTGRPKVLPKGTQPPLLSLRTAGAFAPPADGPGVLFAFYRRR
ncbi:hypothetical protein ACIRPT_10895 [Streptomyces sp. NPDC101227]|uniref:hypothetical protein n=1 Tax=Streptomyces sp. NPDC101227 TaxID=3366136 RepID=UPI0037F77189